MAGNNPQCLKKAITVSFPKVSKMVRCRFLNHFSDFDYFCRYFFRMKCFKIPIKWDFLKASFKHCWEQFPDHFLCQVCNGDFLLFLERSTKPQKINALLTQMSRIRQEKLKKVEVFCPEVILLLKVYHLVNYWFDAVSWGLKLRGAGSQKPIYINVQ